jgi:hypothetical protein
LLTAVEARRAGDGDWRIGSPLELPIFKKELKNLPMVNEEHRHHGRSVSFGTVSEEREVAQQSLAYILAQLRNFKRGMNDSGKSLHNHQRHPEQILEI